MTNDFIIKICYNLLVNLNINGGIDKMKKVIYHYICLILAIFQCFVFIEGVKSTLKYGAGDLENYGNISGSTIAGVIIILLLMFVIAILDKLLRGVKNYSFTVDCIILTLISPLRWIFELITIIRLHISGLDDDSFERCSDDGLFYMLFNASNDGYSKPLKYKTKSKSKPIKKTKVKITKKKKLSKKEKKAQQNQIYQEIVQRMDNEVIEGENFLRVNKRSDGRYNVFVVPLCSVDDNNLSTFAVQNNDYNGERYINQLIVNGKKIIDNVQFQNTVALSLRPGTYDFEINVIGEVKPSTYEKKVEKINKRFKLNGVVVGNNDVHLVLAMAYGSVVTQTVRTYTGEVINEEFEYFKRKQEFGVVSLNVLNRVCNYWNAHQTNIDEVISLVKIHKNK